MFFRDLVTQDANVVIEHKDDKLNFLIYFNVDSGERWLIVGLCNFCGQCLEGAINPDTRPYNERLDIVVRPEIAKLDKCSLRGVYL